MRELYPNELYHHGVMGQKWGVRNGPPYPLKNHRRLANKIYSLAKSKEPRITQDVTDAVKKSGAKMYGLEHRLKTRESINRKIQTDAKEKEISDYKAAKDLKDAVRYTALAEDDTFTNAYRSIKNELQKKGYDEVRCRNYFDSYRKGKAKHKSVQCVYKDSEGYLFEIQFQTPSSQKAKDEKVPLYERRRTPGLSLREQQYLENEMDKLAKKVPTPKGVYTIKSYG